MIMRRHRRPITDRSELEDATVGAGSLIQPSGSESPSAAPDASEALKRDEDHTPKATAPQ
jgi:hypothetical protein